MSYFRATSLPEANIAQLVEQLIRNEQVVGSSPTVGSNVFFPIVNVAINFTLRHFFYRNFVAFRYNSCISKRPAHISP